MSQRSKETKYLQFTCRYPMYNGTGKKYKQEIYLHAVSSSKLKVHIFVLNSLMNVLFSNKWALWVFTSREQISFHSFQQEIYLHALS